jgi:hypothetical protein
VGHWRLKGYDCAIDDFGKDGSSYRRLLTVPFNVLKLDCALLWQARQGNDSEQTLLAREKLGRMVELAHSMDMYMDAPGLPSFQFMMVRERRLHPYIRTLFASIACCLPHPARAMPTTVLPVSPSLRDCPSNRCLYVNYSVKRNALSLC